MSQHTYTPDQDLSLMDLCLIIWDAKKYILACTLIALIAATLYIISATPYYKATMIISPAENMNGAQLSSLLSNDKLFALRHMLQGGNSTTDFDSLEQTFKGQSLAKDLLQNETIVKGIRIEQNTHLFAKDSPLTAASLAEYLEDNISVQPISATNFRRVTYKHPSPEFASFLLQYMHKAADTKLRTKTNTQAAQRIEYLKQAVAQTGNPEHRRALTTLLLEQERLRMLSSIDQPYAATIIEPAATASKPAWPHKPTIIALSALIGAMLGLFIYNIKSYSAYRRAMAESTQDQGISHRPQSYKNWIRPKSNDAGPLTSGKTSPKRTARDAAE